MNKKPESQKHDSRYISEIEKEIKSLTLIEVTRFYDHIGFLKTVHNPALASEDSLEDQKDQK